MRTDPPPGSAPGPGRPGDVEVAGDQLTFAATFGATLQPGAGQGYAANIRVCSCGPLTFAPDCDDRRSPQSGVVLVQAIANGKVPGATIVAGACARGIARNCAWTIDDDCTCPGGATPSCP